MKKTFFACLTLLFSLHAIASTLPDKVRVLAADLQNLRIETPGAPGSELSQDLRRVLETADVDVLCLQGAIDWENCERICQLKPGLQVITCSAFTNAPQVAILARSGAVLSWVEESSGGTGFALAILQAGSRKLAVFSVQAAKPSTAVSPIAERLISELSKLKKFPQNRPDSFLVATAGTLKTTLLADNGFQSVAAEPAAALSPEFFVANAGFLTRPRTVPLKTLRTPAAISDFDTSSSFSSKFAYQTPLLFPGETLASLQAPQPATWKQNSIVWGISIGAFFLFAMILLRKPQPRTAQMLPVTSSNSVIPVDEGMRSNLLAWIKSAFLQRLISHRQELLHNEAEATRRTMQIEERLSTLQTALQARIASYEGRIDRLEQELAAATQDNRDLIRAQIELLKEKVAKAKEEQSLVRN